MISDGINGNLESNEFKFISKRNVSKPDIITTTFNKTTRTVKITGTVYHTSASGVSIPDPFCEVILRRNPIIGRAVCDANGYYELTSDPAYPLEENNNFLILTAEDIYGNGSGDKEENFILDTTPPPVPIVSIKVNKALREVEFIGSKNIDLQYAKIAYKMVGEHSDAVSIANADGSFNIFYPPFTNDGTYQFIFRSEDDYENISAYSDPIEVIIDNVAPSLPIATSITYSGSNATIIGTTDLDSTVKIYNNIGVMIASQKSLSSSFGMTVGPFATGTYFLNLTATDLCDNESTQNPVVINIDTTSPVLTLTNDPAFPQPASIPTLNTTATYYFDSNETGSITSNYPFTTPDSAIVGTNTITFINLGSGIYNFWVKVEDDR